MLLNRTLYPLLVAFALTACGQEAPRQDQNPAPAAQAPAKASPFTAAEVSAWEARAERVEIKRDDWGIPHISAPTDADAVFGLMYTQAEDDFPRIERNFLFSQGREAEADGAAKIFSDLRMKLFIDPEEMQALYADSPDWLRDLMDGWAAGLNYYLHTHPEARPLVLDRFEPWMALTFSEGSIGGDIERVNLAELEAFYGQQGADGSWPRGAPLASRASRGNDDQDIRSPANAVATNSVVTESVATTAPLASALQFPEEPTGSNGFAIAPANSASGAALLLINPHTSFYFRHEAHVTSDEGLNAYGALTWGQFFVYQGFNETAGWMHTSSRVDNIDEFAETIVEQDGNLAYVYGDEQRPLASRQVTVSYRTPDGAMAERDFTVYRSHHGPIVRQADSKWIATGLMEEPLKALIQSYNRTKAANMDEFLAVMASHTNSSNNTIFADAEGNIAHFFSNFIPVRDDSLDYSRPVDGSDPATDWQGLHTVEGSPNAINPATGYVTNTNNWPYSAAGAASPSPADFPSYMDNAGENPRGLHALRVLDGVKGFTLERLREAAYDSYLTAFEPLIPAMVNAWTELDDGDPRKADLTEPVATLKAWDLRYAKDSVATALAIFYGEELLTLARAQTDASGMAQIDYAASMPAADHFNALSSAMGRLEANFGSWQTPWGDINRFQRLTGEIDLPYDDNKPSLPVAFASGRWGSLASFGARSREGTRKWYGSSGNSFVAVVEFGERLRARAVTAGGLSNDPQSPHFDDQAQRYADGDLREVYFYPEQLEGHTERTYKPGE